MLPQGNPELQNYVFDGDGRGTDIKKNVDTLALYAAKTGSHGSDMHFCIIQQKLTDLPAPTKLSLLGDQYEELDYKIARAEYMKHYNILNSQLCAFYSTVWGQCTKHLQARVTAQPDYNHMYSRQDSLMLLNTLRTLIYNFDQRCHYSWLIRN